MKRINNIIFLVLLCSLSNCKPVATETNKKEKSESSMLDSDSYKLAVGTYTKKEGHVDGKADGVYLLKMDKKSGALTWVDTIPNLINPSYVAVDGKTLYAANENNPGTVTKVNLNGHTKIEVAKTEGIAPCHVITIPKSDYLVVASYMGVVSLFKTEPKLELLHTLKPEGSFAGPPRQESSHPHMAMLAPDNKTILISDLGMDNLIHLHIVEDKLVERAHTVLAEVAGPRHMCLHSNNNIYVLNELNHTIDVLKWQDESKPLQLKKTYSTLPERNENVFPAAIHLHPSEKYLYASNRGINDAEQSISLFEVKEDGLLEYIDRYNTGGLVPRDFAISPNGKFLLAANQNSDNIVTFAIDTNSGALQRIGTDFEIKTPVCLKFY